MGMLIWFIAATIKLIFLAFLLLVLAALCLLAGLPAAPAPKLSLSVPRRKGPKPDAEPRAVLQKRDV